MSAEVKATESANQYRPSNGSPGDAGNGNAPVAYNSSEQAVEETIRDDPELKQIASRLDRDVNFDPDRDLNIEVASDTSDNVSRDASDTASISTTGSGAANNDSPKDSKSKSVSRSKSKSSEKDSPVKTNGSSLKPSDSVRSKTSVTSSSSKSSKSETSGASGGKNPLRMLKKLTKFDKEKDKGKKSQDFASEFGAVTVDKLPQVFVVKYLGHQTVTGVCGLQHVRRPVDAMVRAVKDKLQEGGEAVELPLLYVVVSPKGLDLRQHQHSKVQDGAPLGLLPIDFISYGVQDIKYWRVFTCIVVRELSARTRTATCHAFLTDSSHSGRKMALALGAAFNLYSSKLKSAGKVHNFQVELRPPDALAEEATNAEFEA